jgi:tRNA G18 (ribose-2'-O)-methylase SpoU
MKGMYLSLISLIIMSLPRFRVAAFTRIHQGRSLFHCSWPKSSLNLPLLVHEAATALVVSGLPRYYTRSSRLHLAAESESQSDTFPSTLERTNLLQRQLSQLDIDASALHEAAIQSIQNPTEGYNNSYGKSAIRCYRSFIYPKSDEFTPDPIQQLAFASRCARQVDFLIKRHKSAQSDLIRHVDTSTERTVYPIILVLDNVRSALNVGSLFRTADATGCTMVVTVGITPHPLGSGADKLAKSALGAEHCVPSKHFELVTDVLKYLRDTYPDYTLVGMETTHFSLDYTQMEYPRRGIVLFLGNEVTGVDTEILPLLNQVVEIPMHGLKNSLNIAACAPVVLYEILRQWDATRRR